MRSAMLGAAVIGAANRALGPLPCPKLSLDRALDGELPAGNFFCNTTICCWGAVSLTFRLLKSPCQTDRIS
jgi:hypothetical protein